MRSEGGSLMVVDGNEAAASIAYRCNELMFIYPITPASAMGELSAARLGRVVESLLALARTEHERPARGRVDLGAVVAERGATWGAIARERGVDLTVPQSRRKTWALATPGHLEQILDNLIANALDASPSGATVAVTIGSHEGRVEVHVADEGPGLTPEERRLAVERFWRAPAAKSGGSGLGLTIANRLVALDGGSLELRAAPLGGIDAVVRLQTTG